MRLPHPAFLVGALAALAGCTGDDAPPPAPARQPAAVAVAAAAERSVAVLAMRGLTVALPVPAGVQVVETPAHGVVTEAGGVCLYRSANGWSGIETVVVADADGRRQVLVIDVDRNRGVPELVSGAQVPGASPGPTGIAGRIPGPSDQEVTADLAACDTGAACLAPAVSGDGRRVAFISTAGNLDGASEDGAAVFLVDRQDGTVARIAALAGAPAVVDDPWDEDVTAVAGAAIMLDGAGRSLVHVSGPMGRRQVRQVAGGVATPLSLAMDGGEADGDSMAPASDAAGRLVAFQSTAMNLVPDDGNQDMDVFVRDVSVGRTLRVSSAWHGGDADGPSFLPAVSADGHAVAFHALASDLVDDDGNGMSDVFVRDLRTGCIGRVSLPDGGQGEADGPSSCASLSADGRWVAFQSRAGNLVADDTNRVSDVFVHDRRTGATIRVSRGHDGAEADGPSLRPVISGDGRFVTFLSAAVNLVPGGGDGRLHAYRHDRLIGTTRRIDLAVDGQAAQAECGWVQADAAGRVAVFASPAALVPEVMRAGMMNVYAAVLPMGVIN